MKTRTKIKNSMKTLLWSYLCIITSQMKAFLKNNIGNTSTEIGSTSKLVTTTKVHWKKANNTETGIIDTASISLLRNTMKRSMVLNMESIVRYILKKGESIFLTKKIYSITQCSVMRKKRLAFIKAIVWYYKKMKQKMKLIKNFSKKKNNNSNHFWKSKV